MMYVHTPNPELAEALDMIAQLHNAQARIRELEKENADLRCLMFGLAGDYNTLKADAHEREVKDAQDICALVSENLRLTRRLEAATWNEKAAKPHRPGRRVFING